MNDELMIVAGALLVVSVLVVLAMVLVGRMGPRGRIGRMKREPEAVVLVRSWKKMGREEIARQLSGWGETDPRWRALWDLYGEEFEAVLMEVHSVPATLEGMLEWKGRMQMLLHLRAQLLNLRGAQVLGEEVRG